MEKKFVTDGHGTQFEVLGTTTAGYIVQLPNGNKAAMDRNGRLLYVINKTEQEIAAEEREKNVEAMRKMFKEELATLKNELLAELKKA